MKNLAARILCGGLLLGAATATHAQTAWLFGEQHDQPDHQRQAAAAVRALADAGKLHAVVLEMAERGRHTRGLSHQATEAEARAALQWNDDAWPWARYRDVVMNAVQAGVPVLGGNLPRAQMRSVMKEAHWDQLVPEPARQRLLAAVNEGHCGLLPESQLAPMTRVQIARDRNLAETLSEAARDAKPSDVLVMLSGAVHASRETGVPLHVGAMAPALALRSIGFEAAGNNATGFDEWRTARSEPTADHCAELAQRGMPTQGVPAASSLKQ